MSELLTQQVQRLALGICQRFQRGEGREDAIQQCVLHYLRIYREVDVKQNPFNYLSCTFRNVLRQIARVNRHKHAEYQDDWDGQKRPSEMRTPKCQSRKLPVHPRRKYMVEQENQVVGLWTKCQHRKKGEPAYSTIMKRIQLGWEYDAAVNTPLLKPRNLAKPPKNLKVARRLYRQRIQRGWDAVRAATQPPGQPNDIRKAIDSQTKWYATLNGERLTVREWCRRLGLSASTVDTRIRYQGKTPEEALTMQPLRPATKKRT